MLIIIVVAGYKLISYYYENSTAKNAFSDLSSTFQTAADKYSSEKTDMQNNTLSEKEKKQQLQESMVAALTYMRGYNADTFGWLTVEGTKIDYPVMHTPTDPEHYLYRNFQDESSSSGTPFLDWRGTLDSDNLIIYGHNMKSGTMFHDLLLFQEEDFFHENTTITLTLEDGVHTYQIIAAFPSVIDLNKNGFHWWDYINFATEEEFNTYVDSLREVALFDVAFDAKFGDARLITLATCAYHDSYGRMVVVGMEIED